MTDREDQSSGLVYEALLAELPKFAPAGPLEFLGAAADVYWGPGTDAVPAALTTQFSQDALLRAGVIRRNDAGPLRMADGLSAPGGPLVVLRGPGDSIQDVLTSDGTLSGRTPLLASMEIEPAWEPDDEVMKVVEKEQVDLEGALLVAFDVDDVAALRMLDYPATLAIGLDDLSPDQIDRMASAFEWEYDDRGPGRRGARLHVGGEGRPLIFVGWSPAQLQLQRPPAMDAVARHFDEVARLMDLASVEAQVWLPDAELIDRLQFFARHRDVGRFRKALAVSLCASSGTSLSRSSREDLPSRETLDTMVSALQRVHRSGHGSAGSRSGRSDRAGDFGRFVQIVDQRIVQPQIEAAEFCADPQERSLRVVSAELSRTVILQGTELGRALAEDLTDPAGRGIGSDFQRQVEGLTAMTDRLLRVLDMQRSRSPATALPTLSIRSAPLPRLPETNDVWSPDLPSTPEEPALETAPPDGPAS